ncbi:MAG: histidine kinase [Chloroflexi bacterium]|nr:histidine kinase [Chloroflexota bacterium]
MGDGDRLQQLEARLADLKGRMPAHSVRPAMLMEMEDLEEEIARLRAELKKRGGDA